MALGSPVWLLAVFARRMGRVCCPWQVELRPGPRRSPGMAPDALYVSSACSARGLPSLPANWALTAPLRLNGMRYTLGE
jgi:hypothetical protein